MNLLKKILKLIVRSLLAGIGILMLGVVVLYYYLTSYDPQIITTPVTVTKSKPIFLTCVGERGKIQVKEYIPIDFSELPQLLQKEYWNRVPQAYRPKRREIIAEMFFQIREWFGRVEAYTPTIYQQVAHNGLVLHNRVYPLRVEEAALAVTIYGKYRQETILNCYTNQLYFGQGVFGFGAAARHYFGKNIAYLSVEQLALLVGMAQAYYGPGMGSSGESPLKNAELIQMRNRMLERMVSKRLLSTLEAEVGKNRPLGLIVKVE